jgi:hypothetical protein
LNGRGGARLGIRVSAHVRTGRGTNFTDRHRRVLREIGSDGIEPEKLSGGWEFEDLERQEMIVFWPIGGKKPRNACGGRIGPGRWYLTPAGAAEIGLEQRPRG